MTLRRRLSFQLAASLSAIALLSIAAIVGVDALRQDFAIALAANAQLRDVYQVGARVAIAQSQLQNDPRNAPAALRSLRSAGELLDAIEPVPPRDLIDTRPQLDATRAAIRSAIELLARNDVNASLARPMSALADLSAATRRAIERAQQSADQKHQRIVTLVALLAATTIVLVVILFWRQYRSIMRPLATLQRAVQRLAAGHLDERLSVAGDREFETLAREFNQMADQLRGVQRDLQNRVEVKSRALLQSDRLASVGYLAAGVAHEINNPLGIIAGYGERTLRKLDAATPSDQTAALSRSIQIMCDEAFRCKQITDRLLQLARPSGPSARRTVSLLAAAREAITPLSALNRFAGQNIFVESLAAADDELAASVNEGELRQMLLNLLINALEACQPGEGTIHIELRRSGAVIQLAIIDSGRGMTAETASRVFEPFYSRKQTSTEAADRVGTGLGLSIVHAIVADHGGSIEAHSDGIGKGSSFIVRLPAATVDCEAINEAVE